MTAATALFAARVAAAFLPAARRLRVLAAFFPVDAISSLRLTFVNG